MTAHPRCPQLIWGQTRRRTNPLIPASRHPLVHGLVRHPLLRSGKVLPTFNRWSPSAGEDRGWDRAGQGDQAEATAAQAESARQSARQGGCGADREDARSEGLEIVTAARAKASEDAAAIVGTPSGRSRPSDPGGGVAAGRGRCAGTELARKIIGEALADSARQSRAIDRFLDEIEATLRRGAARRRMRGSSRQRSGRCGRATSPCCRPPASRPRCSVRSCSSVVDAQLRSAVVASRGSDPRARLGKAARRTPVMGGRTREWPTSSATLAGAVVEKRTCRASRRSLPSRCSLAEARGDIEAVEDELFRLAQTMVGQRSCDWRWPTAELAQGQGDLVGALLEGRVSRHPRLLATRGASCADAMSAMLGRRDGWRRRAALVARWPRPRRYGPAQASTAGGGPRRTYGRQVRLTVAIDPEVIGGISVRVGNEVMDGTGGTGWRTPDAGSPAERHDPFPTGPSRGPCGHEEETEDHG